MPKPKTAKNENPFDAGGEKPAIADLGKAESVTTGELLADTAPAPGPSNIEIENAPAPEVSAQVPETPAAQPMETPASEAKSDQPHGAQNLETSGAQSVTASEIVSGSLPPAPLNNAEPGKKRRGRPPIHGKYSQKNFPSGEPSKINIADPAPATDPLTDVAPVKERNYRATAQIIFGASTQLLSGMLGPEWRPTDEKEAESVILPLEDYLRTQEMEDLPPGIVLALSAGIYAAPRLRQPSTSNKLKLAWQWVKVKFGSFGKKKSPFAVEKPQA